MIAGDLTRKEAEHGTFECFEDWTVGVRPAHSRGRTRTPHFAGAAVAAFRTRLPALGAPVLRGRRRNRRTDSRARTQGRAGEGCRAGGRGSPEDEAASCTAVARARDGAAGVAPCV